MSMSKRICVAGVCLEEADVASTVCPLAGSSQRRDVRDRLHRQSLLYPVDRPIGSVSAGRNAAGPVDGAQSWLDLWRPHAAVRGELDPGHPLAEKRSGSLHTIANIASVRPSSSERKVLSCHRHTLINPLSSPVI
jgi:hypothetical protein